ncbi:MAG: hypothetical protein MJZ18_10615, partial [Bacteroidales bacterium]|nr:hypothetical protein [Bacteroidales bacterium]
ETIHFRTLSSLIFFHKVSANFDKFKYCSEIFENYAVAKVIVMYSDKVYYGNTLVHRNFLSM